MIIATPEMNLYYTDWVSQSESDNVVQHNCLRIAVKIDDGHVSHEITFYCMSELPWKFNVENDDFFQKFTFSQLSKKNIASEQLYLWSAPIDIIERYQSYLNQLSRSNDLSLGMEVFYNCTMPKRFGPMCQYEFDYHYPHHSSLHEIIHDFYRDHEYNPATFTCYTHLKCNRGPSPSCLDWSEICDGKFDCLDGGFDEEHCWQLEINQCKDNEYRCRNGQCIPQSFYQDSSSSPDCVDASDVPFSCGFVPMFCQSGEEPSFSCEDISCQSSPSTSSCVKKRANLLMTTMYSSKDSSVSENCWSAFKCLINFINFEHTTCDKLCKHNACIQIVQNDCPDMLYFPNVPVLFGNVYFAYKKNELQYWTNSSTAPLYICYDKSHYDDAFINVSKIFFNNMACVHSKLVLSQQILSSYPMQALHINIINELHELLKKYLLTFSYTPAICNRPNMYQCARSSKCISIYRLMDTTYDCPHMDDENIAAISNTNRMEYVKKTYFKCQTSNKYIPQSLVKNCICDCGLIESGWCEDEDLDVTYIKTNILFQHICDGFIDLLPIMIDGRTETDETDCEQWKCDNIYTRCNNVWNCPNGADESGCDASLPLNCSSNHHLCVSPRTNKFMCLPIGKANDGQVDCLGATDEPTLCETKIQQIYSTFDDYFYCMTQAAQSCVSKLTLCDGYNNCQHGDDEQFCTTNRTTDKDLSICSAINYFIASDVEKFLCRHQVSGRKWSIIHFRLDGIKNLVEDQTKNMENTIVSSSSTTRMPGQHQSRCHRGLDLRIWLNNKNNLTANTCLCPPSSYGDHCQYQNQRISLTIQFRALSNSYQTPFTILISLIDDSDQRIIHSYEQMTFLSMRDFKTKYNIYLLYSTRPKDPNKHYSIHIHFYEKFSLTYRGSLLLPVSFPFLPVHRLSFFVDIPRIDYNTRICSNDRCIHGQCIRYSNNPENLMFCQCEPGWSGKYCTIPHICTCSPDSLCIGVSANNRSICICPMNKFGPRCLLIDTVCQANNQLTCQNGGQCIPNDHDMISHQKFICICRTGFSGDRCEIADTKLIVSFDKDIVLSQSVFIHFIEVTDYKGQIRSTTFKRIPVKSDSMIIYWPKPFRLVFIELINKNYYLAVVQKIYNQQANIVKMINPSDRCPPINELFNKTFIQWHLLRRIKYYHLPCQNQSFNLSCFYDDVHLCLCYNFGQKRLANCFTFDHNMRFDCQGQSECENGGQCLQDSPDGPSRSICICPPCFYGQRCQFSTSGFGVSLDTIIGYHILPNVSIIHQPSIVKFSVSLTIIMIVAGLINGILCIIIFKNKIVREVGCGLYLLCSSIITLITTIMFGLKFWILFLAQQTVISNELFLLIQCISLDCILRVCLSMDQWLHACMTTERAVAAIKDRLFDKKKSKQAAKLIIVLLLIFIIGTSIHDPIYRRLFYEDDDDGQKRIWCVVTYSSNLKIYNYVIYCFQFFGPFIINMVSAFICILVRSRKLSNHFIQRSYKQILREQFQEHKHLLIASVVLIIFASPRLIMIFTSKCLQLVDNSWLFLVGYFISFIPPIITFVVFIVQSKIYRKEFFNFIHRYRSNIQRRLHLIS